jgi:hypothetical protein
MTTFGTHALTRADIRKIEEALNTNDLEVMVATVDRIVALRLRGARHAAAVGIQAVRSVDHVYATK